MIREVSLDEISDGKLYTDNDLVKAETSGCSGCTAMCCKDMDNNIVLDPRDIFEIIRASKEAEEQEAGESLKFSDFDSLLASEYIQLNLVDGIILPNINMKNESRACSFLNDSDRCTIHSYRPGICRMFPLGRYWESSDKFYYILQKNQCYKDGLAKVKVKNWLGIEDLEEYSSFSSNWHKYLCDVRAEMANLSEENRQIFNLYNLKTFYKTSYRAKNLTGFYREFSMRLRKVRKELNLD
ncbi:YkgJ family cysteine cluster protein [Lachnospira pectinoschiza]|uniref:Flagellin N-methylase n=1 Tax=Lachnospira pectinoschiza TaxID=28052 RepID=A0A1G9WZW8_9FIRM|nr:YkgJ family cysteine cluster protein [Lachnospira pectinoschiza]SDM89997.1 hypothetical protein SAMN05216544_1409 [Lachnospira pectinoschiza]